MILQQDQVDRFLSISATGWAAIGSIVGAISIVALSVFNWAYLSAARRAAKAAEKSASAANEQAITAQKTLEFMNDQLTRAERPFVAIHREYGANLI